MSLKYGSRSSCALFSTIVSVSALIAMVLVFSIRPAHASTLTFQNVIDTGDVTFNQELGINNSGMVAGYFGSGMAGFPNKGYTTTAPYTSFTNENYPGSVQTQVTGLNNTGTTVGFWSNTNNGVGMDSNFGFVDVGGTFTNVNDPATPTTGLTFNQLLGVNNSGIAVGFYIDMSGNAHGYTYNITSKTFSADVNDPSAVGSTTAAAINNSGEIAGFYTDAAGNTDGFIDNGGTFTTLDVTGAMSTSLLGLNNDGEAVGFDTYASGTMHGVICNTTALTCTEVDDPSGIGTTTFNGVNDLGQIAGFYVNGTGNTIGLIASPVPEPSPAVLVLGALMGLVGLGRRRAWC